MYKKRFLLFFLFTFISLSSHAITFEFLSTHNPVKLAFVTEFQQLANFHLQISKSEPASPLFVRIEYIIDQDTLTDYRYLDLNFQGTIKEMNLPKGAVVTVNLYLHMQGFEKIDNLKGELSYKLIPAKEAEELDGMRKFIGSVWTSKEQILFKIKNENIVKRKVELSLLLTENYAYDKLYLKIKAVSPTEGILLLDKIVEITKTDYLEFKGKTIAISLDEFKISKEGNYYIQITHQMPVQYLNGIESIAYKIIDI